MLFVMMVGDVCGMLRLLDVVLGVWSDDVSDDVCVGVLECVGVVL